MNPTLRKGLLAVASTLLAVLLVAGLSLLTNSLDTTRFSWDFRYYIGMAQHPFAPPEASPFAYRYATPLLVWGISNASALSTEGAFRAVAYAGAILQLLGVFLFVWWLTRSAGGAYLALVVTAFSLFNVKFLLFDIYRPDHLAFAFILLQTYFALKRQYWPLLLSTAVAVQVREFNIAPLIAYLFILWSARREEDPARQRARVIQETLVSTLALILAFGVPRLLIPVAEDYQFASLTRDGLLRVLLAPFILPRDANFVYSVAAYLLPSLMIAGGVEAAAALAAIDMSTRRYLLAYSGIVLLLSFLGGTDFYRFAAFLFLPQAVFVALVAKQSHV
ncbi:MAG: hypothetical protein ACK2T0_10505, partial [Anaerolineales bacterium]